MPYRLLILGVFVLAVAFGVAAAEDEKDKKKEEKIPDLDTIMLDAHGEGGLRAKIRSAQKGKKLADAKKPAEDWVKLAVAMGKHKPPSGEVASWKKLCDGYEKAVKDVAKAVKDDKDADLTKALTAVNATCKGCHDAHK